MAFTITLQYLLSSGPGARCQLKVTYVGLTEGDQTKFTQPRGRGRGDLVSPAKATLLGLTVNNGGKPLHCLVLLLGPSLSKDFTWDHHRFPNSARRGKCSLGSPINIASLTEAKYMNEAR